MYVGELRVMSGDKGVTVKMSPVVRFCIDTRLAAPDPGCW